MTNDRFRGGGGSPSKLLRGQGSIQLAIKLGSSLFAVVLGLAWLFSDDGSLDYVTSGTTTFFNNPSSFANENTSTVSPQKQQEQRTQKSDNTTSKNSLE